MRRIRRHREFVPICLALSLFLFLLPFANAEFFKIKASSVTGDNMGNISGFDNITNNGYGGALRSADLITRGPWLDVRAYGAVGDGTTDDRAAIQSAIDNANAAGGGEVFLPQTASGNFHIDAPIVMKTGVRLHGGGGYYSTRIYADNCNAIAIAAGTTDFALYDLELAQKVRHTVTANTNIGIDINGTTGSHVTNGTFRNVFVDGFQTSVDVTFFDSSVFDNFRASYGAVAIQATDACENIVVTNSLISMDASTSSRAIYFTNSATTATEAWTITNSVLHNAYVGIDAQNTSNIYVSNCILDAIGNVGIQSVTVGGSNATMNWRIIGNHIGLTTANGTTGIHVNDNNASVQNTGHAIIGNMIHTYGSGVMSYGIRLLGAELKTSVVMGNTIRGASISDIYEDTAVGTNNVIVGNACVSGLDNGIYLDHGALVSGNACKVYYTRNTVYTNIGKMRVSYDEAAPTTGTGAVGDIVFNVTPAVDNTISSAPAYWYCSVAGSPGTWVAVYPVFKLKPASATALGKPGMIAVGADNTMCWNMPATDNAWRCVTGTAP